MRRQPKEWRRVANLDFDRIELIGQSKAEEEVHYHLVVEVLMSFDANYGADADGHRGYPMTFIDDYEVVEMEDSLNRKWNLRDLPQWVYDKIDKSLDDKDLQYEDEDEEDDNY